MSFLLCLALLAAQPAEPARAERAVPMMGTVLELTVEAAERGAALAAGEAAVRALEATEARLSTWRRESELARLNRAPVTEAVALSPELAAELAAAEACRRRTGGAFDPGIGALLLAWDVRGAGRVPADAERRTALAGGGLAGLELAAGSALRRRPSLVIDEGGFGKGAGLDRALAAMAASGVVQRALLDLGGQVAVYGGSSAEPFRVEVADPRQRRRPVLAFGLAAGSAATSGNSERGLTVAGERFSHILDPATGLPVRDFGSLTVVAPGALEADCLATGLYVRGPDAALAWAAAQPGIEVLTVEPRGDRLLARATPGLAGRLSVLVDDLTFEPLPAALTAEVPVSGPRIRSAEHDSPCSER